ncbi:hypothetical protein YTPLAS18_27630 [Nitrospira sp.]|nr:hypothetical protein YTPLAS18_27630 [Nitrospira sp.]
MGSTRGPGSGKLESFFAVGITPDDMGGNDAPTLAVLSPNSAADSLARPGEHSSATSSIDAANQNAIGLVIQETPAQGGR